MEKKLIEFILFDTIYFNLFDFILFILIYSIWFYINLFDFIDFNLFYLIYFNLIYFNWFNLTFLRLIGRRTDRWWRWCQGHYRVTGRLVGDFARKPLGGFVSWWPSRRAGRDRRCPCRGVRPLRRTFARGTGRPCPNFPASPPSPNRRRRGAVAICVLPANQKSSQFVCRSVD